MSSTVEEVASTPSFKRAKNEAATTATDEPEHEHEHPADVAAAAAAASAAVPEGSDPDAHASHPYYQYPHHYPYPYDYAAYSAGHEHPHHHPTTYAHHTAVHGGLHGPETEHESTAVVSPPDQEITSTPIRSTAASGGAAAGGDMPPLSYGYDQPYSYYYPPPHLMHVAPSPVNTAASSLALMASQSPPENSRKRKASYDQQQSQQQQYDGASGYYSGQGPYAGAPPDGAGAYAEADEGDGERIIFRLYRDEDKGALSERHCYVRQCYIQAFTATASDVSSRHSKGAQKLNQGQVGVRCIFCSHLPHGDRAERAVCYPRSISRLYQTVADMQRFHFENCPCIPIKTKETYRALKTSRKRGQEKPQDYWIRSARELGLYDNPDGGIYYDATRAVAVPYDADEGSEDRAAAEADAADAEAEAAAAADAAARAAAREDEDDAVQKEEEGRKKTWDGGIPV